MQQHQRNKLAILGTVFVLSVIMGISVFGHASSAYTEIGTNDIQNSLLTPLLNPINPTYLIVDESALNVLGNPLPSHITFSLSESYNGGVPQNIASCTAFSLGSALATCIFNAPFKGWGHYLFIGTVSSSNGAKLAQTGIDPYIEPEW